eukprot:SAG31_NODE_1213_length_9359_cov_4.298164_14_plen_52_part_00
MRAFDQNLRRHQWKRLVKGAHFSRTKLDVLFKHLDDKFDSTSSFVFLKMPT